MRNSIRWEVKEWYKDTHHNEEHGSNQAEESEFGKSGQDEELSLSRRESGSDSGAREAQNAEHEESTDANRPSEAEFVVVEHLAEGDGKDDSTEGGPGDGDYKNLGVSNSSMQVNEERLREIHTPHCGAALLVKVLSSCCHPGCHGHTHSKAAEDTLG